MPFDRDSVQLTNFVVPNMRRPMAPRPERDSIYGNTYGGVPNPMIPHQHPYPTRYHGPVFNYPQPGYRYATRPYAYAPFNGLGAGFGEPEVGDRSDYGTAFLFWGIGFASALVAVMFWPSKK